MREIKPNDIVLHKPTGEKWVVCGVNNATGELIPCGHPFPSIAKISDCELLESKYMTKPQTIEQINLLKEYGLTNFIDVTSTMFHGVFGGGD